MGAAGLDPLVFTLVSGARRGRVRNRVRELRLALSPAPTQQDLADRVGATRQTIIAIEAEKYAPTLELAFRLAAVLGAPFEAVFSYEPEV
jgi:putative transcriptional regulator